MFYRNRNIAAIFNTLRLHLRLVRALQIAGGYREYFIHRACHYLQIGRLQVLNGGLHLDFEVLQRSRLVENWGMIHKMRQKTTPTERLHFTCGQLQLLTSNDSPGNPGTLLMGCVTASGVPDSSRRHPEATHDVFSCTQSWKPAAQKSPKIAKTFQFTRGSQYGEYIIDEKKKETRVCCSPGG